MIETSEAPTAGPAAQLAGAMSLGAGLVHAAVIGPHAEDTTLVWMFIAAAVLQCGVGVALLLRPARRVAAAVLAVNALCLATWVASRTVGIGFIDSLEKSEPVELTDGLAAAMAGLAVVGAGVVLLRPRRRLATGFADVAIVPVVVATLLLTVPALAGAGRHGTDGHSHGDGPAAEQAAGSGHSHGSADPNAPTTAAPKPFDPAAPVDLSGVPGVTADQQKWAEDLLSRTLERLPQWSDPAVAEAAGYRSIGDGFTGHEHFMLWSSINDQRFFDPDQPESLVYDTTSGGQKLVAAMYMLPTSYTLDTVPDDGGPLIQYHVHDDLCFSDSDPPRLVGLSSGPTCTVGKKLGQAPMFHVWITPNRCGPFAALEGVGGGQIAAGEERACDHVHGSGSF